MKGNLKHVSLFHVIMEIQPESRSFLEDRKPLSKQYSAIFVPTLYRGVEAGYK
jgi:hypothetical protein